MNFFNLGIGEIIFILIIALIIFGPGNMVKAAHDLGVFIRKVTKSPYWKEVWATRRELTEIPKIIAKEAKLNETITELNKESKEIKSSFATQMTDFIRDVEKTASANITAAKNPVPASESAGGANNIPTEDQQKPVDNAETAAIETPTKTESSSEDDAQESENKG